MNCRLCLTECTIENSFLLFENKRNKLWTKIIFKYLAIKIEQSDDYSTAICAECYRHLDDFHTFCQFIEQRQEAMQQSANELEYARFPQSPLHIKTEIYEEEAFTETAYDSSFKVDVETENFPFTNETEKTAADVFVKNEAVPNEQKHQEGDYKQKDSNVNYTEEDRTCVLCNKMHKSYKALQSHMYKIHNDIMPYVCSRCGLQFRFRPNLKRHLEDANCATKGEAAPEDIERRTCSICHKVNQSLKGLKRHIYRYHSDESHERPFICNKCGFGFRFYYSLKRHLSKDQCGKTSMHIASKAFDRDEDRTCGICHRKFKNVDTLSSHMYITHKGAKPFACKTCGLEFRLRGTFLRHFSKCSGIPFEESKISMPTKDAEDNESSNDNVCTLCNLVFDDASTLYLHLTKTHIIKPFVCQTCGKCFVLKRAFEAHSSQKCSTN